MADRTDTHTHTHTHVAHHLALAALASQPLKSGTLSLYLSVPVPVLTPSGVISRLLLPAGLPLHLTRLLLCLRFGFADHCARL